MAKVTDHIIQAGGKTLFSIEIIPPPKGSNSIDELLDAIEPMMELNPPFIDVTYHREEYFIKQMPDGGQKEVRTRRRPGTVGICSAIMHKFDVDPVPHVLCGGFSREDTEDLLFDLNYLGIDNVMALRGDIAKPFNIFKPKKGGHTYASDLIKQIKDLNAGRYLYEDGEHDLHTDFCIGAAAYPEKHYEADDLDIDFENLKKKIAAGADYIVTQMFFDNQKYFQFVDKCRSEGITVPIIPGLKPISTLKQLNVIPHRFHVDLPEALIKSIIKCKTNVEVRQVGIEWCIQQSLELKKAGIPMLHYYSMGKSDNIKAIAEAVF